MVFIRTESIASRRLTRWLLYPSVVAVAFVTGSLHAQCPTNVAGGTQSRLTVDGVLLTRYAKGLRNPELTSGLANSGQISNVAQENIARDEASFDVDGDGSFTATDALILSRHIAGMRGDALLQGVSVGALGTRKSATEISVYLSNGCPFVLSPTRKQASRFLAQASFGAKREDITSLTQ